VRPGVGQRTIALAGLGRAAREIHLPAIAGIPGLAIVGGCDPAVRPADFSFPLFASTEEMLERARPDLLAVLAPPSEHFALTALGLRAGCHVLCEKPFMPTLAEAEQVCRLGREAKRWVVVNNQYRFMSIHAEARRRIGTPEFGGLLFLDAHQSFYVSDATESGWRGRDRRRTCQEFGTHVLDLCRFLFDEDPVAVTARMPRPGGEGGPDYLNLIRLDFSGDRSAQITLDRLSRGPHRYLTLRLDGSAGFVETRIGGAAELRLGVRGGARRPFAEWDFALGGQARLFHGESSRTIAKEPLNVFAHATRRLLHAFLAALDGGGVPPCHAEDNRRTLALMVAAYDSDESRATVEMRY
jgi:predicted dehydrogenase